MPLIALTDKNGWTARDLRRAAAGLGVALVTARWRDLRAGLDADGEQVRAGDAVLTQADAVLLRTIRIASFEQIFFRLDAVHRVAAAGVPVVNPPRSIELAVDKYMALARMRAAGLPTPDTHVAQRCADGIEAFDALGGDVVVKPLFGSEGFGIARISERVLAQRAFAQLERHGQVAYVQRFVEHGSADLRLFVLDGRVLAAMCRRGIDWRTNIALGGRGERCDPGPELGGLACRAAEACGTVMAGVDLVIDPRGRPWVLEVNAVPGWRALAATTGIDVASHVLAALAARASP